MKASDVKTLQEVARENEVDPQTLIVRLKFLNEGDDFRRLGKRQPILLMPSGVKKILKSYKKSID